MNKSEIRNQKAEMARLGRLLVCSFLFSAFSVLAFAQPLPMPPGWKPPLKTITRSAETFYGVQMRKTNKLYKLVIVPVPDVTVSFFPIAATNGWHGFAPMFKFSPAIMQRFNSNIVFKVECSLTLEPWNMLARWGTLTNRSGVIGVSPVGFGLPTDSTMFYKVEILE